MKVISITKTADINLTVNDVRIIKEVFSESDPELDSEEHKLFKRFIDLYDRLY